jgi:hypothetical protein
MSVVQTKTAKSNNISFEDILAKFQHNIDKLALDLYPPEPAYKSVYFIALEDNNMFLYLSYEKSNEEIMQDCLEQYDYVKLFRPTRVVYVMENAELSDLHEQLKILMKMFGENTARGGDYTDIILTEEQEKELHLQN